MEILTRIIPLALLVLFVFAVLLMVIVLIRYAGFLLGEYSKDHSQLDRSIRAIRFIAYENISGRLSYVKVFLLSVVISILIMLSIFLPINSCTYIAYRQLTVAITNCSNTVPSLRTGMALDL